MSGESGEGKAAGWKKAGMILVSGSACLLVFPLGAYRAGVALWEILKYVIPGGVGA